MIASVCGIVERENKLISVRPLKSRYVPTIGDVVVGRVTGVHFVVVCSLWIAKPGFMEYGYILCLGRYFEH